jgi:hypothetical protein
MRMAACGNFENMPYFQVSDICTMRDKIQQRSYIHLLPFAWTKLTTGFLAL